jgi:hypothetical protein
MMAMMVAVAVRRVALLGVGFALLLSAVGCATGPLGSHGVDYIPAFDAPNQYGNG